MTMSPIVNAEKFTNSTSLLENPEKLRQQAAQDGYLFFKGLLPANELLALRRDIVNVCVRHGLLDENCDPMEAVAAPGKAIVESDNSVSVSSKYIPYYLDIQKLRTFHAMAQHPTLISTLKKLFAGKVLPHSRNISRIVFPQSAQYTTPPHQDYIYIKGTYETWTAWIPCGDCPAKLGSLAILPGTHKEKKVLPTRKAQGAGGRATDLPADSTWLCGDYECGDVLLLHSLCVHQGLNNETESLVRLSLDYRYQPMDLPIHPSSMQPHLDVADWEEIYKEWPVDDPLKFYWKDWPLSYTED